MKKAKKIVGGALLLLAANYKLKAQELRGFTTSSWSGVAQVSENPASIAGHMYKWDFILAGASVNADNNFVYWNKNETRFKTSDDQLSLAPAANSTYFNYEHALHGPAFMYSINRKSAIAIGFRSRAQASLFNVSNRASQAFYAYQNNQGADLVGSNETFNVHATVWQEIFATYATVVSNAGPTRQKVGITPKLLIGSSQAQGGFSQIAFTQNGQNVSFNNALGSVHYSSNLDSARTTNALFGLNGRGFGFDIGYEVAYSPNNVSCGFSRGGNATVCTGPQYKYRFGVALTDVGFTSFKNGQYASDFEYNNTEGVDAANLLGGIDDIPEAHDSVSTVASMSANSGRYYTSLPTQLAVDLDYQVYKSVFVNGQVRANVSQVFAKHTVSTPAELNVTPRIENSTFGVFAPLSINQYGNFDYGMGFRAGPLVLGVTDLNAVMTKQNVNDLGAYIMFKSFFRCKKGRRGGKVICPSI